MTTYGYCRVSTKQQSLERQSKNILAAFPDAVIIQDKYTGTTMSRPNWDKLIKRIQPGDTIVFDSVSRMSRDAAAGFAVYEQMFNAGVNLVFLKEPQINTATYKNAITNAVPLTGTSVDLILQGVNAYLMELAKEQIRISFEQAEKEVQDNHQRTREGIAVARANGKRIGLEKGTTLTTKKSIAAKAAILKYSKDFDGTLDDAAVITLAKCSRNSYYKYKAELRAERAAV